MAISPKERYVAYTTHKGTIQIYSIDLKSSQPVIFTSYYHEISITQIKWRQHETQLILGDDKGRVHLVHLNNAMVNTFSNSFIEMIVSQ